MLLVDSSVWIEFFRKPGRVDLSSMAATEEIVTCLPVIQEVLQGFRDEGAFRQAREALLALPIVASPVGAARFLEAADLYRRARHAGVPVRSSVDCLIASFALHYDLEVYHFDRDYDALACVSALRVRRLALPESRT